MNKYVQGTIAAVALGLATTASQAATVFAPTNQDVNFINIFSSDLTGLELAMFDDDIVDINGDPVFGGAPWLSLDLAGDVASFTPTIGQNVDYTVTNNASDSLSLLGNDNFILALRRGMPGDSNFIPWAEADSVVCSGATNACTASWNFGTTELIVDVALVSSVPVPAALWLFGSGILGFTLVGRRRDK